MQTARCPSALLYLLLCLPDHSISPHLSWPSLHHGRKWLQLPLNSLCFTISRRPLHAPLFWQSIQTDSSSFRLPLLHPTVQTSVSEKLTVTCCSEPSAQIWIAAVWRCVCDNSSSSSVLSGMPATSVNAYAREITPQPCAHVPLQCCCQLIKTARKFHTSQKLTPWKTRHCQGANIWNLIEVLQLLQGTLGNKLICRGHGDMWTLVSIDFSSSRTQNWNTFKTELKYHTNKKIISVYIIKDTSSPHGPSGGQSQCLKRSDKVQLV